MPNLNELRNAVNHKLNQLWSNVTGKQYQYKQNHGHYWQGLRTHIFNQPTFEEASGDATAPDSLNNHPSDQIDSWMDQFPALDNVPISGALQMDVYDGVEGDGYVLTAFIKYNNRLYSRSQNVGPEEWRTQNWHIEESDVI